MVRELWPLTAPGQLPPTKGQSRQIEPTRYIKLRGVVKMAVKEQKAAAFTLVETIVAMAVLAIAALSALQYQYFSNHQSRMARMETATTRAARLLLEDWKSTGGSEYYDPEELELGFEPINESDADLDNDDVLRNRARHLDNMSPGLADSHIYETEIDGSRVVVLLFWNDVAEDELSHTVLRKLTVAAIWGNRRDNRYRDTEDGDEDEKNRKYLGDQLLTFSTYVRLDSGGG